MYVPTYIFTGLFALPDFDFRRQTEELYSQKSHLSFCDAFKDHPYIKKLMD